MNRISRLAAICVTSATVLVSAHIANAQQTPNVPPAPVPIQILTAKKIFIANGDTDPVLGIPSLAYGEFYASLKRLGIYEFVQTPAEADVVLEVRTEIWIPTQEVYVLRLAIIDPKTSILLWRITEHVQPWAREATGRKNFDEAMAALVSDLNKLIVSPRTTIGAATPGS
jgi:hypothetical protein